MLRDEATRPLGEDLQAHGEDLHEARQQGNDSCGARGTHMDAAGTLLTTSFHLPAAGEMIRRTCNGRRLRKHAGKMRGNGGVALATTACTTNASSLPPQLSEGVSNEKSSSGATDCRNVDIVTRITYSCQGASPKKWRARSTRQAALQIQSQPYATRQLFDKGQTQSLHWKEGHSEALLGSVATWLCSAEGEEIDEFPYAVPGRCGVQTGWFPHLRKTFS
jgi:hypothetical protein